MLRDIGDRREIAEDRHLGKRTLTHAPNSRLLGWRTRRVLAGQLAELVPSLEAPLRQNGCERVEANAGADLRGRCQHPQMLLIALTELRRPGAADRLSMGADTVSKLRANERPGPQHAYSMPGIQEMTSKPSNQRPSGRRMAGAGRLRSGRPGPSLPVFMLGMITTGHAEGQWEVTQAARSNDSPSPG